MKDPDIIFLVDPSEFPPPPKDAPVLKAEEHLIDYGFARITRWGIWCKYCNRHHFHGRVPGHRVAHCSDETGARNTPYTKTGYFIEAPDERKETP